MLTMCGRFWGNNMSKNIVVIYHSADFDGLFCREIARKFLPDAELIGWDFKDAPLDIPIAEVIYVLDLPLDVVFGAKYKVEDDKTTSFKFLDGTTDKMDAYFNMLSKVVWIDHHITSIESHPTQVKGYRIDGVAACRLAQQWFTMVDGNTKRVGAEIGMPIRFAGVLPMIQDYKNHEVKEPLAVRLVGEYDILDKRDPRTDLFQFGLRSQELTAHTWEMLLNEKIDPAIEGTGQDFTDSELMVGALLNHGHALQFARDHEYAEVILGQGFTVDFEGIKFLACNSHELDIRSELFKAGIKSHHEALMGFTFNGHDWRVSLYRIKGRDEDILSIAKSYGGGGHAGACGFRIKSLPFLICLTI